MDPDIMGTQELEPDQVADLLPLIDDRYTFISINTDTGEQDGIFFKKSRFHLHKEEIFEMSPTTTPLTMVQLEDRKTGKYVAILNAHFSFSYIEKRTSQARYVAKKVESLVEHIPVIFMGDLNTFPNRLDKGFPAFDGDYVAKILTKKSLKDSLDASVLGHVGPIGTFTNNYPGIIPFEGTGTPGVFLDHIYVTSGITVLLHAVQPATVDGHFPSDHMPVVIDCVVH